MSLLNLSDEILVTIFELLPLRDYVTLKSVCKPFERMCDDKGAILDKRKTLFDDSKLEEKALKLSERILEDLRTSGFSYTEILDSWMLDEYHSLTYSQRRLLPKAIERIVLRELPVDLKLYFSDNVHYGRRFISAQMLDVELRRKLQRFEVRWCRRSKSFVETRS